jgi:hypothetical protein
MRWLACLLLLAACGDTTDGTRSKCAVGGALNSGCEEPRTVEGACWRLVDCGAILLQAQMNRFGWPECVSDLDGLAPIEQQVVIDCIASSTCDALKVEGSPDNPNAGNMYCLRAGGG